MDDIRATYHAKFDPLHDGKSIVELVSHHGSDKMNVEAARVSHAKDSLTGSFDAKKDIPLLEFMIWNEHGTPFEHNSITFHVNAPLMVIRQWHRHRVGWSYNEMSRRYTKSDIQIYTPKSSALRTQSKSNRQASEGMLLDSKPEEAVLCSLMMEDHARECLDLYNKMLDMGLCREQARGVLPQNMYARMYATCNLRSLAHFHNLRGAKDAQWEIQQFSNAMSSIASVLFPESWKIYSQAGQERRQFNETRYQEIRNDRSSK